MQRLRAGRRLAIKTRTSIFRDADVGGESDYVQRTLSDIWEQVKDAPIEVQYQIILAREAGTYDNFTNGDDIWESEVFANERKRAAQLFALNDIRREPTIGLYTCSKCSCNSVYIVGTYQLSGGDEGMTTIIQCSQCNIQWRER